MVTTERPDPLPFRCRAILIGTYRCRCSRRATVDGLCSQHARFGATVPERWLYDQGSRPQPDGPWHWEGGQS